MTDGAALGKLDHLAACGVTAIEVLNESEPAPFPIDDRVDVDETLRLKHRYVDLRRVPMQENLRNRAAVNAALDLMRRRKRSRRVDLDEVGESLVDTADPGPERLRGSRELKARLREAMSQLSPRQAEIFTLRYLEGLGNLEIARLLGASQTSIAVLLHRARHRLQKELGSLEGEMS